MHCHPVDFQSPSHLWASIVLQIQASLVIKQPHLPEISPQIAPTTTDSDITAIEFCRLTDVKTSVLITLGVCRIYPQELAIPNTVLEIAANIGILAATTATATPMLTTIAAQIGSPNVPASGTLNMIRAETQAMTQPRIPHTMMFLKAAASAPNAKKPTPEYKHSPDKIIATQRAKR